ncbi:hypothetical protein DITRI_Ditri08aG0172100 [Diplodiscus trichospermus]
MGYWKSKVLPKIKKVFEKNSAKKAAAEACKSFDDSKEKISKELEDKQTKLRPKIVEVYEASPPEIKTLVKDPKETGLKKHSAAVHAVLEELAKIEFPGSKAVLEASSKYGTSLIQGPVLFIFEKVATFINVVEEKTVEPPATATQEETRRKEEEIVVEEEKKEEKKEEVVVVQEKAAATTDTLLEP